MAASIPGSALEGGQSHSRQMLELGWGPRPVPGAHAEEEGHGGGCPSRPRQPANACQPDTPLRGQRAALGKEENLPEETTAGVGESGRWAEPGPQPWRGLPWSKRLQGGGGGGGGATCPILHRRAWDLPEEKLRVPETCPSLRLLLSSLPRGLCERTLVRSPESEAGSRCLVMPQSPEVHYRPFQVLHNWPFGRLTAPARSNVGCAEGPTCGPRRHVPVSRMGAGAPGSWGDLELPVAGGEGDAVSRWGARGRGWDEGLRT